MELERCVKRTRLHLEESNTYRYDLCELRGNNLAHRRGTEEALGLELKYFESLGLQFGRHREILFASFSSDLQLHKRNSVSKSTKLAEADLNKDNGNLRANISTFF